MITAIAAPGQGTTPYDAAVVKKIARLPLVEQVADFTIVDPNITPLEPLHMHLAPGESPPNIGGSVDGEYSSVDRLTLTSGRLADPKQVDQMVMSAGAAREFGMHVGSTLSVGFYTNAQQLPGVQPQPGTKLPRPHLAVDLHLVGIVAVHTEVIEDDVDALADSWVILTPALIRELVPCSAFVTETTIRIEGGDRNVPAVQAEIARALPALTGSRSNGDLTSTEVAKAERAIEPESIALGVFGGIAALAALLIAGQLIGRQLRRDGHDRLVIRALGAGTATTVTDGLMGVAAAVLLGALLAANRRGRDVAARAARTRPARGASGLRRRLDCARRGCGDAGRGADRCRARRSRTTTRPIALPAANGSAPEHRASAARPATPDFRLRRPRGSGSRSAPAPDPRRCRCARRSWVRSSPSWW